MASAIAYFPAAGPVVLGIVIALVVSIYLCRTQESKTERENTPPRGSAASEETQQHEDEVETSTADTSRFPSGKDEHPTTSDAGTQSLSRKRQAQTEKEADSVENLQARIAELEERVRWLKERLATGLATDAVAPGQGELDSKSLQAAPGGETEELSERALQQLLEALDEKLAKGTISQQLYQRLRDKYLARLSKARGRREAASERAPGKPRRRR